MSFNDPYYTQQHNRPQFQQPYDDTPAYDPYSSQQRHPTYDASGYTDEDPKQARSNESVAKREPNRYDDVATFAPTPLPPKSKGGLQSWRRDHHGNLWTKGGRGRCVGRFCCCSLLIAIFLIFSIVFTLGLFFVPPNITVNNVGFPTTGSAFRVTSDSLNLNLGVNITVNNPNYFSVAFKRIKADLTYPINNTNVGGGEKGNIVFHSHEQTTFEFPFQLTYTLANDPGELILQDLISKCGIGGAPKSDIKVKYKITLGIQVLFVTISPSFSNDFSLECPVTQADLADLLKNSGLNIPGVTA